MESHIKVQDGVPARVKRLSVGPEEGNESTVEPSPIVEETCMYRGSSED